MRTKRKIKQKIRQTVITDRHMDIIECLAAGYTTDEIAQELSLSKTLIHSELNTLFKDTKTINRTHLVAWAFQNKVLKVTSV